MAGCDDEEDGETCTFWFVSVACGFNSNSQSQHRQLFDTSNELYWFWCVFFIRKNVICSFCRATTCNTKQPSYFSHPVWWCAVQSLHISHCHSVGPCPCRMLTKEHFETAIVLRVLQKSIMTFPFIRSIVLASFIPHELRDILRSSILDIFFLLIRFRNHFQNDYRFV